MAAEDIKSLFDRWNEALRTLDPDAVTLLYSADATLLPTVSNKMRRNHAEIRDYFEMFLENKPRGVVNESNVRDFGDLAIHSGIYTFELTTDGETRTVPCRFTFVYRNEGGDWKIIEHHSSAMPEQQQAEPEAEVTAVGEQRASRGLPGSGNRWHGYSSALAGALRRSCQRARSRVIP